MTSTLVADLPPPPRGRPRKLTRAMLRGQLYSREVTVWDVWADSGERSFRFVARVRSQAAAETLAMQMTWSADILVVPVTGDLYTRKERPATDTTDSP